jgi:lysozyme
MLLASVLAMVQHFEGASFTRAQIKHGLVKARREIRLTVVHPLPSHQLDALSSFVFNIGASKWRSSQLLKVLNSKAPDCSVANQFERWVHDAQGKPLAGLKRRRRAEKTMFLKGQRCR